MLTTQKSVRAKKSGEEPKRNKVRIHGTMFSKVCKTLAKWVSSPEHLVETSARFSTLFLKPNGKIVFQRFGSIQLPSSGNDSLMMVAVCYRNVGKQVSPIWLVFCKPWRCLQYLATQAFSRWYYVGVVDSLEQVKR